MFNMHPGEFLNLFYVQSERLNQEDLAERMKVSPKVVQDLLAERISMNAELAVRLQAVLGRSAESWLALQRMYDLALARQSVAVDELRPYDFAARYKLSPEELIASMPQEISA